MGLPGASCRYCSSLVWCFLRPQRHKTGRGQRTNYAQQQSRPQSPQATKSNSIYTLYTLYIYIYMCIYIYIYLFILLLLLLLLFIHIHTYKLKGSSCPWPPTPPSYARSMPGSQRLIRKEPCIPCLTLSPGRFRGLGFRV